MGGGGFLAPVEVPERLAAADREAVGHVMNLSRVWAHDPQAQDDLFAVSSGVCERAGLGPRARAVVVVAAVSALGDSYCSLAWGGRLAEAVGAEAAAGVLRGDDSGLEPAERVLAAWARRCVREPGGTTAADVQALREAGWSEAQVLAATVLVGVRLCFSTVNAALGAQPDPELLARVPGAVVEAVTWGRPPAPA